MSENELEETKLEFDVQMTSSLLYDYQIYNAYVKTATGMIGTCFGALGIILGLAYNYIIFIILGAVMVIYTPISLKLRCAQAMASMEVYKKPLHYVLDDTGITVSQGDVTQSLEWDKALKAVSTKHSILVYTGKSNATVFPKKQLGNQLSFLVATLVRNMEPGRVKIRFLN